jgi:hypothetical protein
MLLLYQVSRTNFSRLSAELGISFCHAIPMHHQVCRTYYTADFQQRRTSFHIMLLLQQVSRNYLEDFQERWPSVPVMLLLWKILIAVTQSTKFSMGAGPRFEPRSCLTVDQYTYYATPYLSCAEP